MQGLGLEGKPKKRAFEELIALVRNLGGTIETFSHSREELDRVLKGAANHVDSPSGRGAIIMEARRNGTTKSDLLLLAGRVDDMISDAGIEVKNTPSYIETFQIDEKAFGKVLEDEVPYFNPRAKEDDINSVRSIYVLRGNTVPSSVEKCKAVLVSSNSGFARAAYEYGQQHEVSREVSSVITDFGLANMAWLKAPMGAPSVPMTELLAYSYAALQPSKMLLDKYLTEIDKLQKQGKISERDHQLLRSSTSAQEELVRLTLGDEAAFTEETVTETLRRVSSEIKEEESEKVTQEQESHQATQEKLVETLGERDALQKRIYWKCRRKSQFLAWTVTCAGCVLLVVGIVAGIGLQAQSPVVGWLFLGGSSFLAVATVTNLLLGITARHVFGKVQTKCLTYFLRQEAKVTSVDFEANG